MERYGQISPVPDHDGTECLKWDESLWSHKDHFKVRRLRLRPAPHFKGPVTTFAALTPVSCCSS